MSISQAQAYGGDGFLTCQGGVDQEDSSPLIHGVSTPVLIGGDVRLFVPDSPKVQIELRK